MKLNSPDDIVVGLDAWPADAEVRGETGRLTDVVLCPPTHLKPVPCCSVTRESLREGFESSLTVALYQHENLRRALERNGVRCHTFPPVGGLPDLCFMRDGAVATPWGLVALNPSTPHRAPEIAEVTSFAARHGLALDRISEGHIEGGDICIAREGLLILGVSGERTDRSGADGFASRFHSEGWDVLICPLDPHFLHLDTIFCMIDRQIALGCVEVLDDGFLREIARRGIELLPVTYKEARKLGCNILSLDGHTVLAGSATPRVSGMMRERGFRVTEIDVGQFSACGGGIHCLTLPLRRLPETTSRASPAIKESLSAMPKVAAE